MCEQEAHKKAVGIMVIKEPQVEIIDNHTSHPLKRLKSGNYSGQEDEMALGLLFPRSENPEWCFGNRLEFLPEVKPVAQKSHSQIYD